MNHSSGGQTPYNYAGYSTYANTEYSATNTTASQSYPSGSSYYASSTSYPPYNYAAYSAASQTQSATPVTHAADQYSYGTATTTSQQWSQWQNSYCYAQASTQQTSPWTAQAPAQTSTWTAPRSTTTASTAWSNPTTASTAWSNPATASTAWSNPTTASTAWSNPTGQPDQTSYWNQSSPASNQSDQQWSSSASSQSHPWTARPQTAKHVHTSPSPSYYPAQTPNPTRPRHAISNSFAPSNRPTGPPAPRPMARSGQPRGPVLPPSRSPRSKFGHSQSETRTRAPPPPGFGPRHQVGNFRGPNPRFRGTVPEPRFRTSNPATFDSPKSYGADRRQSKFNDQSRDRLKDGPWGIPSNKSGIHESKRDRSGSRNRPVSRFDRKDSGPRKRSNNVQSLMDIQTGIPDTPERKFRARGCRGGKDKRLWKEEVQRDDSFERGRDRKQPKPQEWNRNDNKGFDRKRARNDSGRSFERPDITARKRRVMEDDDDDGVIRVTFSTRDESYKYYCTVCKVHCKVEQEFQQHLRGKKHQARVKTLEEEGGEMRDEMLEGEELMGDGVEYTDKDIEADAEIMQIPFEDDERMKTFCLPCRFALCDEKNTTCHKTTPKHREKQAAQDAMRNAMDDDQTLCESCAVPVTTDELEAHRNTDDHKRLTRYKCAACEICQMRYNDVKLLEKHLHGEKHGYQLEQLERVTDMSISKLAKYFKKVAANKIIRAQTTCVMCSTVCGNHENMKVHNIIEADRHEEMQKLAAEISDTQFFCYLCARPVEDAERRIHIKRDSHKNNRDKRAKFYCELCGMVQKAERELLSHFYSKAHRAKFQRNQLILQRLEKKFYIDRKAKVNEGLNQLLDIYPTIKAQEEHVEITDVTSEGGGEANTTVVSEDQSGNSQGTSKTLDQADCSEAQADCSEAGRDGADSDSEKQCEKTDGSEEMEKTEVLPPQPGLDKRKATKHVMPVIGEYCGRCQRFFIVATPLIDVCPHIQVARGYPIEKPKSPIAGNPEKGDMNTEENLEDEEAAAADSHNIDGANEELAEARQEQEESTGNEQQKSSNTKEND